jgi:hypothetical protein
MTINYISPDEESGRFLLNAMAATIHGNCYPVAIALHRGLRWPLIGLANNRDIIHAGVRSPDGFLWDGRGGITEEEFKKPFSMLSSFTIQNICEKDLFDRSSAANEYWVELMLKRAQLAWPDLPWVTQTPQDRVLAFATELEELSLKYGLWICGAAPTSLPVIFENKKDEVGGYEVKLTAEGNAFTINRVMK